MTRKCFYIPVEQFDSAGYIPSLVTEGQSGHAPLAGNGAHAEPWHWGKTYEDACKIAEQENARLGVSPADAVEIVLSSMSIAACTPECNHPDGETTGHPFPGRPGYLTGEDGHAVAASEWRAGFRKCEHC